MNPIKKRGKKRKQEGKIKKRSQQELSSSNPTRDQNVPSSLDSTASSSSYLTPQDGVYFQKHLQDHYKGFVHLTVDRLQHDFHQHAKNALERLRDAQYYQYDIVMAGGKHSSRTFVKRTLVGNPGITYKYLGLRLFAHAWSGPGATSLLKSIGDMNESMIKMTEKFPDNGRCDYNLTLINYMEPKIHTKVGFKDEADYNMGKVSVSWHADSSLESGSSIGVYHCLPTQRNTKWDWKIALRNNDSTTIKPVVVNTKDGDAYFLLKNFNETHQHCVLAGSQTNRISSTHRVAVTLEDTYDYILKRVKIARKRFRLQTEAIQSLQSPVSGLDAKVIRYCCRVLTEVETEWIAQYWLQGAQHDKMHLWWQRPMKTLEAYWCALEVYTCRLYNYLCSYESIRTINDTIPIDVIKVLIIELKIRQSFREQWDERRADKIYPRRISLNYRPEARPTFEDDKNERLPKDLTSSIQELSILLEMDCGVNVKTTNKINTSSFTEEVTDTATTNKCKKQSKEEHTSNVKKQKKKKR